MWNIANLTRVKATSSLIFIFYIGLIIFSSCKLGTRKPTVKHEKDLSFKFYSKQVSDSFSISVQLPLAYEEHPDKNYPTVVLTDANFFYPMLAPILHQFEKGGLLPPLILVGIGYRSFEAMDSLRVRDYMYPKAIASDEMEAPGGGKNFFHFITEELLPQVDSSYRTNGQRTLLGHSFGGYFSLYALLEQMNQSTRTFGSFIAASPTLWYHDRYLFQLPHQLQNKSKKDSLQLFLSVGGQEDPTWAIKPVNEFSAQLSTPRLAHFQLKTQVYAPLDHMNAGLLSFIQGLQTFYNEQ